MKTVIQLNHRRLLFNATFGLCLAVVAIPWSTAYAVSPQPTKPWTGNIDRSSQPQIELRGTVDIVPKPVVTTTTTSTTTTTLKKVVEEDPIKRGYIQLRVKAQEHINFRSAQTFAVDGSLSYNTIIEVEVDRSLLERHPVATKIPLGEILRSTYTQRFGKIDLYPARIVHPGKYSTRNMVADHEGMIALGHLVNTKQLEVISSELSDDVSSEDLTAPTDQGPRPDTGTAAESCLLCGVRPVIDALQDLPGLTREFSLDSYSQSEVVEDLVTIAMKRKRSGSRGACYAYVKEALLRAGLIDDYFDSLSAVRAGPHLKARGFVNLLEDEHFKGKILTPEDAPVGTVLVYSGGPIGKRSGIRNGHIEIRTEEGFVSDFFRRGPPPGRTLIGVYYKPAVAAQAEAQ